MNKIPLNLYNIVIFIEFVYVSSDLLLKVKKEIVVTENDISCPSTIALVPDNTTVFNSIRYSFKAGSCYIRCLHFTEAKASSRH
ncbi:hypothetical protein Hrd1104_10005 [Halorhabdus sp. CBA1104]|nr:hypothetical protein Hrd1104_10005 [Halorhabdus sp. CBA1104]